MTENTTPPAPSAHESAILLTTNQAAELLQVSPHTIRDLIRRGELPAVRLRPGRGRGRAEYRVTRAQIEAFLQARAVDGRNKHASVRKEA